MRVRSTILLASALSAIMIVTARADFRCDNAEQAQTHGGPKCDCLGEASCKELRNSDSCKSALNCGTGLGTVSCSCDAKFLANSSSLKIKKPLGKSQK